MAYLSPYHVLEVLQVDPELLDEKNISRLRKKILTDFQLADGYTVKYGKREYTKDDVLKIVEDLRKINGKEAHLFIYRNPELLQFCENPAKAKNPVETVATILANPDSDAVLAGFVAEAELEHFRYVLRQHLYDRAIKVVELFKWVQEIYRIEFLEIVVRHVQTIANQIDSDDKAYLKTEFKTGKLAWIADSKWPEFFNELGEEFLDQRNSLAVDMINFAIAFQNVNNRMLYRMSKQMLLLDCDDEYRRLMAGNHKVYSENRYDFKFGPAMSFRGAFAIIWLIVIVIRCAGFFDKKPSTPANYKNILEEMKVNQNELLQSERMQQLTKQQDSILEALDMDSVKRLKLWRSPDK
jgi:hypothetical protein